MNFVILGGGIAGTTVAEYLPQFTEDATITIISASPTIKRAVNIKTVSEVIESFDVEESPPEHLRYHFIHAVVQSVNFEDKIIKTSHGEVTYDKLCVALGSKPNVIYPKMTNVFGIRDTESVDTFHKKLQNCKHITIVGNGGIASELVHATKNCNISWVIKDDSISSVFVDTVASKFLLDSLESNKDCVEPKVLKRHVYIASKGPSLDHGTCGSALGPDWYTDLKLGGAEERPGLQIEYSCLVQSIEELPSDSERSLKVTLSSGKIIYTGALVSATGVLPNTELFHNTALQFSDEGGILVNKQMRSTVPDVYAAGDVCTIPWRESRHWKQMRLWTQARQQGFYAARCMGSGDEAEIPDITFDLFTHSTKLFGFKVILLGQFSEYEGCQCYLRITSGVEFVKVIVEDGRVHGALLIGETDLEEVMENLILNQIDISHLGEDLLDPNVDIDDYFD